MSIDTACGALVNDIGGMISVSFDGSLIKFVKTEVIMKISSAHQFYAGLDTNNDLLIQGYLFSPRTS